MKPVHAENGFLSNPVDLHSARTQVNIIHRRQTNGVAPTARYKRIIYYYNMPPAAPRFVLQCRRRPELRSMRNCFKSEKPIVTNYNMAFDRLLRNPVDSNFTDALEIIKRRGKEKKKTSTST